MGPVVYTGTKLEVEVLDGWSHDDLSFFFCDYLMEDRDKQAVIRAIWVRFLI